MTDIATLAIKCDSSDLAKADTKMQGLGKTGQWLEGVIGKAMAAFGAYKVGEYIKAATLLAARYETLGVVMGVVGNNAGYTREQMDGYARSLQDSGISMVESRNTLATMAQAHIDLAKSTELSRLAQDAAVIGNMNSSEAFQRMIYGIQSGQTDVLRTIGLNVNFEQSYAKLAVTLGKATKDLTENEKTTARMNAVLEKAPSLAGAYEASMGTAGKQLLSMKRYAEDLMTVLGDLFGGALRVGVESVNGALRDMKKYLEDNKEAASLMKENIQEGVTNLIDMVKELSKAIGLLEKHEKDSFSFGELLSGAWRTTTAFIHDAAMSIFGAFQMVWSTINRIVAETIHGISAVLHGVSKIAGFGYGEQPKWLTDWISNSDRQFGEGWGNFKGAKKLGEFFNGKPETAPAVFSDQGYRRETGNTDKILEQQRVWEAKHAGGTGGDTITESEHKKAEKRRQAWLKFQGENQAEYARKQMEWDYEDRQDTLNSYIELNNWLLELDEERTANQENVSQIRQAQFTQEAEEIRRIHSDLFGDLGNTMESWSSRTANVFVEMKGGFSDLISSFLKDLARMAMQKNVTDPLFGYLGELLGRLGSRGTTMSSFDIDPSLGPAAASGGYRDGSKPYLVGERGPEIFVPGRSGTIIPNDKLSGGGVTVGSISISISTNGDANVTTDSSKLTQFAGLMKNVALQTIAEQQRAGGMLSPA